MENTNMNASRLLTNLCGSAIVFIQSFINHLHGCDMNFAPSGKRDTLRKKDDPQVCYSKAVLDDFRNNVGRLPAETGGLLASSSTESCVDLCYFDTKSQNTAGSFEYDIESMSAVFREWKSKGYITNGIYHSHPIGCVRPSYHDISTVLLHIDFLRIDYFYLPILQPSRDGLFTMYSYVVKKKGDALIAYLDVVLEAKKRGYVRIPSAPWRKEYSIRQLRAYRETVATNKDGISRKNKRPETKVKTCEMGEAERNEAMISKKFSVIAEERRVIEADQSINSGSEKKNGSKEYFLKVASMYPEHVLDKVIVCIGTGGARSFLENMARCGFRNFLLMDADIISPTNVATQGVFISEMGRKKTRVIRERILDINPDAKVICVNRFLDNNMSDMEFKSYLDRFPCRKPTDFLILGCTDSFDAQKRSSMLALKYGCPYMAAMMYAEGAAAEIIFVYPGVTTSCPRCLLRDRFEKYESGFKNDVDSSSCPIFATERMNSLKGYIALMLLMYHETESSPFSKMLDDVKERNFVEIRLTPYLKDTKLGIGLFDRVFAAASKYVYFDETIWVPQHPDSPEFGSKPCRMCGGGGNLKILCHKWKNIDTREIRMEESEENISNA